MFDPILNSNIDSIYVQNIEKHLQNCQYKIDSLQNVLEKHQVTESYFNHILNAQLGIFILLVSLIVLISIGGYIVFFKKYLKKKIDNSKADILQMFEYEKLRLSAWNNFALYELYNTDSRKAIECLLYVLKIVDIYMTRKLKISEPKMVLNEYIDKWIDTAIVKLDLIDKIGKDNVLLPYFENIFFSLEDTIRKEGENIIFEKKVLEIKKKYYSKIK